MKTKTKDDFYARRLIKYHAKTYWMFPKFSVEKKEKVYYFDIEHLEYKTITDLKKEINYDYKHPPVNRNGWVGC